MPIIGILSKVFLWFLIGMFVRMDTLAPYQLLGLSRILTSVAARD